MNLLKQVDRQLIQRSNAAAKQLQAARLAFCEAMLKVQSLEHACRLADKSFEAFVPAGLGTPLDLTPCYLHATLCSVPPH